MRALGQLQARYLPRGAAILSVLIFGSYLAGLLRDRIFARTFGAGAELDAYNAAFVLPELLLDVLVEAGLAAPFIPIFLRLRSSETDPAEGDRFARTILTAAVTVMGVAAVLMLVFADATTSFIAPGFTGEQRELYVSLFRVMLVTPILFAASLTLGQVLLAEQRYFWYGIAPMLYNAGIIAGTVALQRLARHLRPGHRRGHRGGHPPRQPLRRAAGQHLPDRARMGGAHRIGRRVRAAHAAEGDQPAGGADHVPLLHQRGVGPGRRERHRAAATRATSRASRSA